jgi:hypothetical protein
LAPDGSTLATWLVEGVDRDLGEGFLVAVDDLGRVYTVDNLSRQIKVFAPAEPPSLSLNPNSGTCATRIELIGELFAPGSNVGVYVAPEGSDTFTWVSGLPLESDGSFRVVENGIQQYMGCDGGATPALGARLTVLVAALGPHDINVVNLDASPYASAKFTYLGETPALLTLTPNVGACDTPEVASGVDFTPGSNLAIYVNIIGGHEPALGANVTVADDGTFSVALDVTSIRACDPGFNPDEVYVVWAGPDNAGKQDVATPGRSAGTLFFAARDVPVAVATREWLPFCGADLEVARQFIDPTDAPLLCLRDAAARNAAGEMATRASTPDGETIKLFRASGGTVEVITATRATDELQYAWTRRTCASVEVSVQPISVSGCSAVAQLSLAR